MKTDPAGRVLKVTKGTAALSSVQLDNGVTSTITILARPDQLPALLDSDLTDIRNHLMSRKPGHFRVKPRLGQNDLGTEPRIS